MWRGIQKTFCSSFIIHTYLGNRYLRHLSMSQEQSRVPLEQRKNGFLYTLNIGGDRGKHLARQLRHHILLYVPGLFFRVMHLELQPEDRTSPNLGKYWPGYAGIAWNCKGDSCSLWRMQRP